MKERRSIQPAVVRCKLVLVGDVQCGKTAMLQVLAKDSYPEVCAILNFFFLFNEAGVLFKQDNHIARCIQCHPRCMLFMNRTSALFYSVVKECRIYRRLVTARLQCYAVQVASGLSCKRLRMPDTSIKKYYSSRLMSFNCCVCIASMQTTTM